MVTLFSMGCKTPASNAHEVVLDLQSGFLGAPVTVLVDNEILYQGNATSDPVIGLAHSITVRCNSRFRLRIEVERKLVYDREIDTAEGKFIGAYLIGLKCRVRQQETLFLYD